jgi:hypothetical protein
MGLVPDVADSGDLGDDSSRAAQNRRASPWHSFAEAEGRALSAVEGERRSRQSNDPNRRSLPPPPGSSQLIPFWRGFDPDRVALTVPLASSLCRDREVAPVRPIRSHLR